MIRLRARFAALVCAAIVAFAPLGARADIVSDPQTLYNTMRFAYDKGAQHGWTYTDYTTYLSTILDAGRAYALRRPKTDPNIPEITAAAVDIGTRLNYDPLTNRDAAAWYVRAAATLVAQSGAPDQQTKARALLAKLDQAESSVAALARIGDQDATANLLAFPNDANAQIAQVETDWRAWLLTKDRTYRTLALKRASAPAFPLARLADTIDGDLLNNARGAADGGTGFSDEEVAYAKAIQQHRAALKEPIVIARVNSMTHEGMLVLRAPADQYFGRQGMSILGVRNELDRINRYLDASWGARMETAGLSVAEAVDDWQRQYPRDYELPAVLLRTAQMLSRIDTPDAKAAAAHLRSELEVNYTDSPQAQQLLAS